MIDLWLAKLDDLGDTLSTKWLASDECNKLQMFATPALQREYLVTRILARWALSQYAAVDPSAWRFERTEEGRPFVIEPTTNVPSFNLSNAAGLVVCAVSPDLVGVDVESSASGDDFLPMNVFTPDERASLDPRRAVELWTRKEAYLKARGGGINVHLSRLDLRQAPPGWQVAPLDVPDPWIGAVAVQSTQPLSIVIRPVDRDIFDGR
jgi:4'-phosphopantetheinyl transferase